MVNRNGLSLEARPLSDLAEQLRTINERLIISSVREQESAEVAKHERAQLSGLLEALSEGVIIADPCGGILMLNAAARAIMGLTKVASSPALRMAQVNSIELRTLENTPIADGERPLERAMRGENFVDLEALLTHGNGERRRILMNGTSITDGGAVALAILVLRDVTDMRRLEQQRDEFLALISHDLRGPVCAIALVAESMKRLDGEDRLGERAFERITRIEKNAATINSMIAELLEATSLEGDPVALVRQSCNVLEIIGGAVDRLEDELRSRVGIEAMDGHCCEVSADAAQLGRAFVNLLTNALKYSTEVVRVRITRRDAEAVVEVCDRGIGIGPENRARLSDRYYRVPRGRHVGGLGLGLYIARLITEAHGGHIEVESELGKGSTFRLYLPLVVVDA